MRRQPCVVPAGIPFADIGLFPGDGEQAPGRSVLAWSTVSHPTRQHSHKEQKQASESAYLFALSRHRASIGVSQNDSTGSYGMPAGIGKRRGLRTTGLGLGVGRKYSTV